MNAYQELKQRGLIHNESEGVKDMLTGDNEIAFYVGYDPTAESLTLGNYLTIRMAQILMKNNHKPYLIMGTLTGSIGDPSGKADERKLMDDYTIKKNAKKIADQLSVIAVQNSPVTCFIVSNDSLHRNEWNGEIELVDFLRDYGKHLTISYMMSKTSVKKRLASDNGISFTEFSYQLVQAADYVRLNEKYGVTLQLGGSDQWGNITSGIELCRKKLKVGVQGLTCPLLTTSNGDKIGKSEEGALWLDVNMTSAYSLYQYFFSTNIDDLDLEKLFLALSKKPVEAIQYIFAKDEAGEYINYTQKEQRELLAYSIVDDLHGKRSAEKAKLTAALLFGDSKGKPLGPKEFTFGDWGAIQDNLPEKIVGNILQYDLGWLIGRHSKVSSKSALRRELEAGSIKVNGRKLKPGDTILHSDLLFSKYAILQIGKKNKIILKNNPTIGL